VNRKICLIAALAMAGCASTPDPDVPERIVTVEVAVPVAQPCVPATLGPAPDYPDTDEALRSAPDAATRYLLIAAGRLLRIARLGEVEPVVAACPKATGE
jgi:hypothetical protein